MLGHIGRSTGNSNLVMTLSTGGAKTYLDHRFRAPPAYTAQLLTLHQHKANTTSIGQQIKSSPLLQVCSRTQAILEKSPIQVLSKLNVAWLQWSYENWYFQVDKPLRPSSGFYQLGNTSSHTITEVKQRWACLVLAWETVQVLPECCC